VTNSELDMKDQIELIDKELRAMFPQAPFARIKQELLIDETAIIVTLKQYRGLLQYRLKNYRPKLKQVTQRKSIRTELLPDWFEETPQKDQSQKSEEEIKVQREDIKRKLKELRN
jgi:replication initiation and membrane attachment protein DnaB